MGSTSVGPRHLEMPTTSLLSPRPLTHPPSLPQFPHQRQPSGTAVGGRKSTHMPMTCVHTMAHTRIRPSDLEARALSVSSSISGGTVVCERGSPYF